MRPAMKRIAIAIPLLLVAVAFAQNFPELRRYLRMRRM